MLTESICCRGTVREGESDCHLDSWLFDWSNFVLGFTREKQLTKHVVSTSHIVWLSGIDHSKPGCLYSNKWTAFENGKMNLLLRSCDCRQTISLNISMFLTLVATVAVSLLECSPIRVRNRVEFINSEICISRLNFVTETHERIVFRVSSSAQMATTPSPTTRSRSQSNYLSMVSFDVVSKLLDFNPRVQLLVDWRTTKNFLLHRTKTTD